MNTNTRRMICMLLIAAAFCLAMGSAMAEGACMHEAMNFTVTNGSSTLTQTCEACGHNSYITVSPLVVMEGEDYAATIETGGDPWDGPDAPADMTIRYYAEKFGPGQQGTPIEKPTAPGTYYAGTSCFRQFHIFGQLTIVSRDHAHSYSYTASENVITARCGCGMTASLTLRMNSGYAGEAAPAVLEADSRWPGSLPAVSYYTAQGEQLPELPQDAGEYYAAVSVAGQTAVAPFTLREEPIVPAPIPADRILSNKPHGMVFAAETRRDGFFNAVISTAQTDWSAMVARLYDTVRDMMIWQTPHLAPYPGATGFASVSVESFDEAAVKAAVETLMGQSKNNLRDGENAAIGFANIGRYTPENGLFTPSPSPVIRDVLGWYKNGRLAAVELLEYSFTYDDTASFTIQADEIPSARILPAVNLSGSDALEHAVSDGAVAYRADSRGALDASAIETGVQLPDEVASRAASCELRRDMLSQPVSLPLETIGGRIGVRVSTELPAQANALGCGYILTFYDAQGEYIKAYNLTVTIRLGEIVPFPLYHSDWNPIPESRIVLKTSNTSGKAVPKGLGLSYNAEHGIVNYDIDSRRLPRGQALGAVLGTVSIEAPEGAKAYRMYPPYEGGLSIRPDIYSMNNDDSLHAQERIAQSPMIAMEGGYDRDIEYPFLEGREISLIKNHPYILYRLGLPAMGELGGGFRLIYWYADADDEEPMLKEYLLVTHDPASAPSYSAPVSHNSDLPDEDATIPRIVISAAAADGEEYLFYSDVVPQTSDDELHYELRLIDRDGKPVSTQTLRSLAPMTVCIPVPEGADSHALSFTVSHLDAESTKVTETFSFADGSLELTEHGLCFTVDALSPFVVSWDETEPEAPPVLPQTGDDSPALGILLAALLACVGMQAVLLRRKRA